jgi:formate/nitrite transporter FocA (FNT family)
MQVEESPGSRKKMGFEVGETQGKSDKPKGARQILQEQIETGIGEYNRTGFSLFLSAFAAGLEIGFSLLLMGALYTLYAGRVDDSSLHLVISLSYSLGFIFVMMGRSELFTEHTALAILPVLNNQESLKKLGKVWVLVYFGNIIGGYIFSLMIVYLGPKIGFVSLDAFHHLATDLVDHSGTTIFYSGILAGWMMGLLGWLWTSAQETIGRIFIIVMITSVIALGGLHHCIIGSIEVFSGLLSGQGVNASDYIKFQSWATLGNALGGVVFVAILKFSHAK